MTTSVHNSVIIRSAIDIATLPKRVSAVFTGKPLELVLREYKPKRSLTQNARLWALHTMTAKRLNDVLMTAMEDAPNPVFALALKSPWTAQRVHDSIYKPQFLAGKSSTRRNKMETVDDQGAYEAWMVQIGVVFDAPADAEEW